MFGKMLGRTAFSLKTKITVLVVFLIVAILFSIGYLQIERDRKLREKERKRRAEAAAKTIISFKIFGNDVAYKDVDDFLARFLDQEELAQDIVFISFHDSKGKILAGAVNKRIVKSYKVVKTVEGEAVEELRDIESVEDEKEFMDKLFRRRIEETSNSMTVVDMSVNVLDDTKEEIKLIRLGFSTKVLQEEILQSMVVSLSIFAVYIIIGILASVFLGSAISKPIKVLEEAMKRVSAGDLHQNVDIPSRDEIGTLAKTFNYMTEGLREKEKLKKEFLIARDVQFNLLPKGMPEYANLEVATYFEPATEVGGDFYDFLSINDHQLGIVIGDVSGHGMSAGLLMAITKSCLHTQLNYEEDIGKMTGSINNILHGLSEPRSMVTFFYSVLDLDKPTISFTNAGHPFTYLVRGGNPELIPLEAISYPLGIKRDLRFRARQQELQPGDFLVYYSDGIVEALDEEGWVFGYERLEDILVSRKFDSPEELLETVVTEVRIHIGSAEQFDDMTVVVLRIKE